MTRIDPPARDRAHAHAEFEQFFARHHRDLGRLAFLLTGDAAVAQDLTADTLLAAWERWSTVQAADAPFAYVRRIMVNQAASRIRRLRAERRRLVLVTGEWEPAVWSDPGVAVDVRTALLRLPVRRRACVVLRHAFDLSEADVAQVLGISVGTVKSQTFKGMAQLQEALDTSRKEAEAGDRAVRRATARR